MSSSLMSRAPRRNERLEHGRVEPAVGLRHAGERLVGDPLVLERHPEGLLEEAVHVPERDSRPVGGRLELARVARAARSRSRASRRRGSRSACRCRPSARSGGDGLGRRAAPGRRAPRAASARSGGRPRRRPRPRRRARSRSGGARRRSGARRRAEGALERGDARRGRRPARARCACPRGRSLGERLGARGLRERLLRGAALVREEAEDGGEVGARGARELEAVLLGAGVRALVRPDATGAVVLHAHAREEAGAGARRCRRARCSPGAAPTWPARPPERARRSRASRPASARRPRSSRAGRARRRCTGSAPPARPACGRRSRRTEERSGRSSGPALSGS